MTTDISDTRDAILDAETLAKSVIAEVLEEWNRPDKLLKLAVDTATMPDDAWALVDDQTKKGVVEALYEKGK